MPPDTLDLYEQSFDDQQPPEPASENPMDWVLDDLHDAQHLPTAIMSGLAAAILCAGSGCLLIGIFDASPLWLPLPIGLLTGFVVRYFGKGVESKFGVADVGMTWLGCFLGY